MAHSLSDFKSALRGGGARPNLFEVDIYFPPDKFEVVNDDVISNFKILCKAAQLPASNIGVVDVPYRGRIFKVAGDRTFDVWTVTVINDEDFAIRRTMERWAQSIGQYGDGSGYSSPFDYMANASVKQLKRSKTKFKNATGEGLSVAAQYNFYDIFPTNISAIDLSYDSTDTIEEFTVEFQVQYWSPAEVTANSDETPE